MVWMMIISKLATKVMVLKVMKSMQHAVKNAKTSSTNFSSTKNHKGCCSLAWLHWQFFASSGWLCSLLEEIGTASWRLVAGARILRRFQRPWSNVPRMPREAAGGNGWMCSWKMQGKFWWKYWICHLVSGVIFEPERNTILSQMYGWNLVTVVLLQSLLGKWEHCMKATLQFSYWPHPYYLRVVSTFWLAHLPWHRYQWIHCDSLVPCPSKFLTKTIDLPPALVRANDHTGFNILFPQCLW